MNRSRCTRSRAAGADGVGLSRYLASVRFRLGRRLVFRIQHQRADLAREMQIWMILLAFSVSESSSRGGRFAFQHGGLAPSPRLQSHGIAAFLFHDVDDGLVGGNGQHAAGLAQFDLEGRSPPAARPWRTARNARGRRASGALAPAMTASISPLGPQTVGAARRRPAAPAGRRAGSSSPCSDRLSPASAWLGHEQLLRRSNAGEGGGGQRAAIEATGVMPMPPAISSTGSSPAGASCSGKSGGPSAASRPRQRVHVARAAGCFSRRTPGIARGKQPASGVSCTSEARLAQAGEDSVRARTGRAAALRARRKERISGDPAGLRGR